MSIVVWIIGGLIIGLATWLLHFILDRLGPEPPRSRLRSQDLDEVEIYFHDRSRSM